MMMFYLLLMLTSYLMLRKLTKYFLETNWTWANDCDVKNVNEVQKTNEGLSPLLRKKRKYKK